MSGAKKYIATIDAFLGLNTPSRQGHRSGAFFMGWAL